jgi:peroxiredoxin Q/BCP
VVYFYPKDDTPGCTKEACSFRDSFDSLTDAGVTVLGISPDSIESHNKFIEKFDLNFQLLSDKDKSIAKSYGAWGEKNMYGKIVIGMKRMSFLINPEGTVQHIWTKVKTESHGKDVLSLIQETA